MLWVSDLYATGATSPRRGLAAFMLAPILGSIIMVATALPFFMANGDARAVPLEPAAMALGYLAGVVLGVLFVGLPFTFAGMVVIGFPAWLALRYTNNESGLAYALIGAAGGWWIGPALGGRKWQDVPMDLLGLAGGALTLFLFWRMARRRMKISDSTHAGA